MNESSNKIMIVLARKYNDIYYAISTKEWKNVKKHILLIMPNRSTAESFPYKDLFDKCITLPPDKDVSLICSVDYLYNLKKSMQDIKGDIIVMSNPEMLFNRIIFKLSSCKEIIFLEDGLMNYYNYQASNNTLKKAVEHLFNVSDKTYLHKITTTYLTNPTKAKYFFGNKKQIELNIDLSSNIDIPNLSGKKIFIAQDILNVGEKNIKQQEDFFNLIIKKFNIDYYVPRTHDYQEKIEGCNILNLNNKGITLEVLATIFDMEIYGFTTTLLFSLKMVNSRTISHHIISKRTAHLQIPAIINDNIDIFENLDI